MPIVYVSHAAAEVARLATTIVLISDGRVQAVGPVDGSHGARRAIPADRRFRGRRRARRPGRRRTIARWGLTELSGGFGRLLVPRLDLPVGSPLRVRIRARDVILALAPAEGISALNVLPGVVEALVPIDEAALEVQLRARRRAPAGAGDAAVGRERSASPRGARSSR